MPSDTIFAVGSLLITWFVARLWIAPRKAPLVNGRSAESYG